jgi:hypothetical protein
MATLEEVNAIQNSIIEEYKAIPGKLPWWHGVLLGALSLFGFIGALIACGSMGAACTGVTGGAGIAACIWAVVKCILAAVALLIGLIRLAMEAMGYHQELGRIEGKQKALESLRPPG